MSSPTTTTRLIAALMAVAPVESVSVTGIVATVRYQAAATAPQIAVGDAVVAAFDWSAAADATWVAQQAKAQATVDIDNGQLQNGTNVERLVRALALVTLDEINTLRTNAGLATRTAAQLVTAIKGKIAASTE